MLIDFTYIYNKYNMNIRGILHIGAHECEEYDSYLKHGLDVSKQLWIEALPDKVEFCKNKIKDVNIINAVVSDKNDEKVYFNITNNYQSSSILNLKTHLIEHPHINVINQIEMKTTTVKSIYDKYNIEYFKYNFLNIDIQGVELLALKGMENILDFFDYIYLEVNEKELYENCALLPEIDNFLVSKGFKQTDIIITSHGWGDALYIRNKKGIAFDIGANIGNWTKKNINNYDKIIAIEASKNTYEKLCFNLNDSKIEKLNYIVHHKKDNTVFYDCVKAHTLSTTNLDWLSSPDSRFFQTSYTKCILPTISIDKLINIYGTPNLIKIDVEGGEYDCIKSLTTKVPLLCFEWASETNDITLNCLDYLNILGFNHFYLQYEDNYTFIPKFTYFENIGIIKNKLLLTIPKQDWGMMWCY
jgi:FkbM family methyltransferase